MAEEQDNQVMGDPPQDGAELYAQASGGPGDPPPSAPPDDGEYTDEPTAPIKPGDPPPSDSDTDTTTDEPAPSAAPNLGEGDPPPH